jgi:hypothetical protein
MMGAAPTIAFATSTSNPVGLRLTEGDEKGHEFCQRH